MKRLTREWVNKAEADFRAACRLGEAGVRLHDQTCFHCQQSAEKYLKALLQELGLAIPRTHILRDLVDLLLPQHAELTALGRGVKFLTRFAVETRYPGESATRRQADAALRWAERVRIASRRLLGLRS